MPQNSKTIRKRIKSVASTKKITRTMEMVATSKLKRTQGRVVASRPFTQSLRGMMESLAGAVEEVGLSPLFERRDPVKRALVLVVTANRGLCGGFNSNLVRLCRNHLDGLRKDGIEPVLWVAGKKGIAALRFLRIEMAETRTDLSDNPKFEEAEALAAPLLHDFVTGQVDRVDVVFADFQSVARQPPVVQTLLPVGGDIDDENSEEESVRLGSFLFEPSPGDILAELGPTYVNTYLYRVLLSSAASEQIARRVAMKNATDNAGEMEKNLTRAYNKARQAMITQEIAEIVGGVEAMK